MSTQPKILLVDDDQDLLDLYKEMLSELPSQPEIFTSSTGARAMTMMDAEPFTLLICDLNMPKMDGLQVLSIVRRKYPDLRTVVLTSVMDEQFRSRVYSLGVDLFWQKPGSSEEIKQFLECLESLLGRDTQTGFRGVQSKSLVDIIQLECISQSSTVLKIKNGSLCGKIWINNGEIFDATVDGLEGEAAFHKVLSWKSGNFEVLSAEPNHPRVITNSYHALLLETVQAQDEAQDSSKPNVKSVSILSTLAKIPGVEFILSLNTKNEKGIESRGLENPDQVAKWSKQAIKQSRGLGELLGAGQLQQVEGLGPQRHVTLASNDDADICVGWQQNQSLPQIRESMKTLLALWVS
ncbi:response regulator [Pedosphaera parvula]|nr:response regulator [Pedosphaera parvula]